MLIREIKGKIEQAENNKIKKELLKEVLKKQCVDINTIENLIKKLENANKDEEVDLIKRVNNNALTELKELKEIEKLKETKKEIKKETKKENEEYKGIIIGILVKILNKYNNETNVNEIIIDMGMLENIKNKLEGKDLGDKVYLKSVIPTMKLTLNCIYRNMLIREIKGKIEQAENNKIKKELLKEVLKKQCVDINTIENLITKLENANKDEEIHLIKQVNDNALTELTELRNTMGKLEKNQ